MNNRPPVNTLSLLLLFSIIIWYRLLREGRIVQVVIVSPLMRALETAAGAFGAGAFKGEGRPLMLSQTEDLDERAPHAAVACPEGIPFIAFEGCRERLGDRLHQ